MHAKRLLPLALAMLSSALLGPMAYSEDSEPADAGATGAGTVERGLEEGWKGLPGAKDPGEPGKSPGWTEVELKVVPVGKDWGFRTPRDSIKVTKTNVGAWVDVSNGRLPFSGKAGGALRFQPAGGRLQFDSDGDGTFDGAIEGEVVAARLKRGDGTEGPHWFRLRRDDTTWLLNRACLSIGTIDGLAISFIDENNDGDYGDMGEDAVRLGAAPVAQYMSEVVNLRNKLYHLRVDQSGSRAWYKAYEGPTGVVDLASKYKGKSKPLFVMLQQGQIVIDAAAKDTVMPVGSWTLQEGLVGPSMQQSARIRAGRLPAIEVKQGETSQLAWGMPGKIDFSCSKEGNLLRVYMSSVSIYGAAGEEYFDFRPRKFTPNVQAIDERSKKEIYFGNTGAGC